MTLRSVCLSFDGAVVAEIPETPVAEVASIVSRSQAAARAMAELSREQRASILFRASAKLLESKIELARTITLESGKPIREARLEVERAASTLFFSGEEAHRLAGEEIPMDAASGGKGRVGYTIRQPLGVVAAITPFNFPLNLAMHKIGPAIAAGNAVLHKPASATPLSALHAASIFAACGLPKDALQVLVGPGAQLGDALVAAPEVRMISFTGSAEVGMGLAAKAGMKRLTLELGNNSAVLVLEDADLEQAVNACVAGAFANSGQSCISVQRVFVAASLHQTFLDRFVSETKRLKIAHPLEEDSDISCLIHEREAQRVQGWIGEAVREGATLLAGGGRNLATLQPTVLANVARESRLLKDEAFGPVVGINAFSSLEEGIAMANSLHVVTIAFGARSGCATMARSASSRKPDCDTSCPTKTVQRKKTNQDSEIH